MKFKKTVLSIILSVTLIIISITISNAKETISYQDQASCVLSDLLLNHIDELDRDETVSVYLWYPDINQDDISKKAERLSKVDLKEIEKINQEFTSLKEIYNDENFFNEKELINQYIALTENQRKAKSNKVNNYLLQRSSLCSKRYEKEAKKLQCSIGLAEDDIIYCSRLSPMIIANLSVKKIYQLENSPYLESIDYYEDQPLIELSQESAETDLRANKVKEDTGLNLSGSNVKIGLIESRRPLFSTENPQGIVLNTTEPEYRTVNNKLLTDYGNVVVVGDTSPPSNTSNLGHADHMAKDILHLAPNVILYTSSYSKNRIETMILDGVQLFSFSGGFSTDPNSLEYAYKSEEKWFDHLAAYHGVTFIQAAGNSGDNSNHRVMDPGMAYNLITVGGYNQDNNKLDSCTSYNNCNNQMFGCEKPDIVSPNHMFLGGTSNACAFFAGTIALMFELEPALLISPQETKAIVLASCHRKALQTETMGGQEDFDTGIVGRQEYGSQSGITERQGAGCPDVWIMASIICQGTYGSDVLVNDYSYLNVYQPPYDSENMSVSIAFLKDNLPQSNSCGNPSNIIEGVTNNLDLAVYNNNMEVKKSALFYSSTEMCHFQLSDSDYNYRFKIERADSETNPVRYGYAWSTDNPRCTLPRSNNSLVTEGVYHLKNRAIDKYLECKLNPQTENYYVEMNTQSNDNQSSFSSDSLKWIVEDGLSGLTVKSGNGYNVNYLGTYNYTTNNPNYSLLQSMAEDLIIEKTSFGYYCIFNADMDYILSINNGIPYWKTYLNGQTIQTCDTWSFEKSNYLKSDVDRNGTLTTNDLDTIQNYCVGLYDLDNIKCFLADVNHDRVVDMLDSIRCQRILNNGIYYLI